MKNVFVITLTLASSFSASAYSAWEPQPDRALYDELYPVYAEACAVGRAQRMGDKPGQAWGHGVVYLRGACRDTSAAYPRLKTECGPNDEIEVGVSSHAFFSNVSWIAVPGRSLFFHGTLAPNETLDWQVYGRAVDAMIASAAHRGVVPHLGVGEAQPANDAEMMKRMAMGSVDVDYALNWGRSVYCHRVPLAPSQLARTIAYLNERNAYYYEQHREFKLEFSDNNCTHLAHNALAAADLVPMKTIEAWGPAKLFNLAIPMNYVLDTAAATAGAEFPGFLEVYRSRRLTELLMRDDVVPVQDGALAELIPVHGANDAALNQIYHNESQIKFLDLPLFATNKRLANRMATDPTIGRLRDNLERYETIYRERLAKLRGSRDYERQLMVPVNVGRGAPVNRYRAPHAYRIEAVHARYRAYLERKVVETRARLQRVAAAGF